MAKGFTLGYASWPLGHVSICKGLYGMVYILHRFQGQRGPVAGFRFEPCERRGSRRPTWGIGAAARPDPCPLPGAEPTTRAARLHGRGGPPGLDAEAGADARGVPRIHLRAERPPRRGHRPLAAAPRAAAPPGAVGRAARLGGSALRPPRHMDLSGGRRGAHGGMRWILDRTCTVVVPCTAAMAQQRSSSMLEALPAALAGRSAPRDGLAEHR